MVKSKWAITTILSVIGIVLAAYLGYEQIKPKSVGRVAFFEGSQEFPNNAHVQVGPGVHIFQLYAGSFGTYAIEDPEVFLWVFHEPDPEIEIHVAPTPSEHEALPDNTLTSFVWRAYADWKPGVRLSYNITLEIQNPQNLKLQAEIRGGNIKNRMRDLYLEITA